MTEELKPCPFCDRKMETLNFIIINTTYGVYKLCQCHCGARGPAAPSSEEAIKAWNTRGGVRRR